MMTPNPSVEDFSSYNALVSSVGAVALDCLSVKKVHFLDDYTLQWNAGKDAKAMLLQISNHFYSELSTNQEILTCCASAQFDFELTDHDKLALVKEIDQQQVYLDFHGFIDYLESHQLLHFSESISNGLCVLNPRYGTSDVIVRKGLPASGVFLLSHEIGHAYYNSYLPRNAEMGNSLFSEICALLTEFQMMRHLEFSEAAAFAIDLGFRIECDPELQKKFCDYISLASVNHSLSIFEFYSHIGVDTSSTFYTDITNSVNRWLSSLIYTWRKQ